MSGRSLSRTGPYIAWLLILAAAAALVLFLNAPGHMSVDSVISLAEGRTGTRITWGPPMYSAILGFFDRVQSGTILYLGASLTLLLAGWATLLALRPRLRWSGPLLLVLMIATPQLAIYQGIVWKDVLFANLTVAAFVALAVAGRIWQSIPARLFAFLLAATLLAFACLVRQNGFIAVVAAAVVLAWLGARFGGRRSAVGWGLAGLIVPLVLMVALDRFTPVKEAPGTANRDVGVRLLQHYDLAAALAENPLRPMPILDRANPAEMRVFRKAARNVYSPARIDSLSRSQDIGKVIWLLDDEDVSRQWLDMIVDDPVGYGERRLAVFNWVFATPDIDLCLPVHVGIAGPSAEMSLLKLQSRFDGDDVRLFNYVTWYLDTPVMSHVFYAIIALAVGLLLLIRREPGDIAIAGLLGAGLAFAGSFLVISLACDYRYLYLLDISAMTGLLYFMIDPRLKRG